MLQTIGQGVLFAAGLTFICWCTLYFGKGRIRQPSALKKLAWICLVFWSWLLIYMTLLTYGFDPIINDIGFTPLHTLKEIFVYGQKDLIVQLLMNVAIFIPFGLLLGYLFEEVHHASMIMTLGFLISLSVECIQLFVGRSFDFDDILCNTLGAVLGYLLLVLAERITRRFTGEKPSV